MFFGRKTPDNPSDSESSGLKFEIRLTEAALLKLLPWIITLILGGVVGAGWQMSPMQMPHLPSTPAQSEVEQPQP